MASAGDDRSAVTALVLNWNGRRVVGACVRSLLAQDHRPLEVLVVDNASTDGSAEMIERDFPGVRLHRNPANLGFGGGNNVGLALISTTYVLMCNNDIRLDPGCVRRLVDCLERHTEAGAAAPLIVLAEGGRVDAAGIAVCPDGLSLGRGRGRPPHGLREPAEVFFVSDCCCLYRRAMLRDLRLPNGEVYDEDFFAYADETDLGWRARRRGWKSLYEPRALVYHHHAASSGSVSPFLARLVERNRIWVAVKNFPTWLLLAGIGWTLVRYGWQVWAALAGKGRTGAMASERSKREMLRILWQAWREAAAGLTRMLSKRAVILRTGRLGPGDVIALFRRFGIGPRDIALSD